SLTAWLAVLPVEAAADVAAGAGRAAAAPLATWSAATAEPPVVVGANTFGTGALQATLVRTKSMGTAATSGRMRRRSMWSGLPAEGDAARSGKVPPAALRHPTGKQAAHRPGPHRAGQL